ETAALLPVEPSTFDGDAGRSCCAARVGAVGEGSSPLAAACWLLAGLLFQSGSRPLHRTVLGAVKRLPPQQLDVFGAAVTERLRAILAELDTAASSTNSTRQHITAAAAAGDTPTSTQAAPTPTPTPPAEQRCPPPASVPVGEVLASLLWLPAAHTWIRPVVAALVWRLAAGVDNVLAAADRGERHIAPGLMEEVLDAVGSLYYILQHHGQHIVEMERQQAQAQAQEAATAVEVEQGLVPRGGRDAVVLAGRAMLRALQGRALVREALASAAVVLWAASLLPDVAPGAAAAAFGQGLFFT
ncbi:hypothetical protein VaNZ11_012627, partial [Volvox africanus]